MIIPVLGTSKNWAPVPGFAGYEVSDQGELRIYRSINGRGPFKDTPRPVKSRPVAGKPYLRATLTNASGRQQDVKVHVLVLESFVGPRPSPAHDACHRDGNAKNNCLSNLRWGTKQDNADDRQAHGTQVRGSQVTQSKLSEAQAKEIKDALPNWKKGMGRYFAEKFEVSDSSVSAIKRDLTWRHV